MVRPHTYTSGSSSQTLDMAMCMIEGCGSGGGFKHGNLPPAGCGQLHSTYIQFRVGQCGISVDEVMHPRCGCNRHSLVHLLMAGALSSACVRGRGVLLGRMIDPRQHRSGSGQCVRGGSH